MNDAFEQAEYVRADSVERLREALESTTRELDELLNVMSRAVDQCHGALQGRSTASIKAIAEARALLADTDSSQGEEKF